VKPASLHALIFDVDGTLADTESAHRLAFNRAFAEAGLDWHWDEPLYTRLLEVSGGKERIMYFWREMRGNTKSLDNKAQTEMVQRLHQLKTQYYERLVEDGAVQMRPGVLPLIESAKKEGLSLAIATTTSPANIEALMRSAIGSDWRHTFPVVEDAVTAPRKKPHPQAYLQALQRMDRDAVDCLAFEDSANGMQAARAAALLTIVTPNAFTAHHDFRGALRIIPSLEGVTVADLRAWHAAAQQ